MFAYMHICLDVYMFICYNVFMYICICVYICMYIYIYTHVCAYVCVYVYVSVYVHVCMFVYIHTYIYPFLLHLFFSVLFKDANVCAGGRAAQQEMPPPWQLALSCGGIVLKLCYAGDYEEPVSDVKLEFVASNLSAISEAKTAMPPTYCV